jgi:pimeloyl-ACP methyl ester carboxylesterase
MIFKETDNKYLPIIILLHGGGLSDWSLQEITEQLQEEFCVVTPIIDGHGEDGEETFISISESANKLIDYIDTHCNGKVYAIGGLSLGAQILVEVLSQREDIAEYAFIESALVYSMRKVTAIMTPLNKICYGLVKKRWFSKLQAKTLSISSEMFEPYYQDSVKITKQSIINMTVSNGHYDLNGAISNTKSKVFIIVGEKEITIMKKSAERLHNAIHGSELYIAPNMKHGELSLVHAENYIRLIRSFMKCTD